MAKEGKKRPNRKKTFEKRNANEGKLMVSGGTLEFEVGEGTLDAGKKRKGYQKK